ncbi:MAG: glutamate--tRNA ligase [Calditrichia bacterium]
MSGKVVTRFAPSPTGYLHVGGARTALFNYLYAKKHQGKFLLRIEDTDRERSSSEMVSQILDSLKWLGLEWDDEIVFQGANAARHREIAGTLLEKGLAYRCFCTKEELEAKRQSADPKDPRSYLYDGTCRRLTAAEIEQKLQEGRPFSIRFKTPEGATSFRDLIRGNVSVNNQEIGDFIILRSDGSPVYQLAVVVDDHDMGISHIIRGEDHLSNTPKQILIYRAMDWPVPAFAHVPLILGADKKRLSKRHGATSVDEYRQQGYLPEALLNYLGLLGWQPGDDRELLERTEMIELFSLERVSKNGAVFDTDKLNWMNAQYLSGKSNQWLLEEVLPLWKKAPWGRQVPGHFSTESLLRIIELHKPRVKTLSDFVEQCDFYFQAPQQYDPKGVKKNLKNQEIWSWLGIINNELDSLPNFEESALEQTIRGTAEKLGISAGKLIHPIRLAVSGKAATPGLFEILAVLGKEETLKRILKLQELKDSLTE